MSYEELSAHGEEIEALAKKKYAELDDDGIYVENYDGVYSPSGALPSKTFSIEDYAEQLFGGVASMFDEWIGIDDGGQFQSAMDQLASVMSILSEGGYTEGSEGGSGDSGGGNAWITDVGPTGAYMGDWIGKAAFNYQAYIAPRFAPTASNQFGIAASLRNTLRAEQELWKAARDDVDMIAHTAIEHLNSINGDGGGGSWGMTFTVIGAVVGVAAAIPSGGSSLAFAAAGSGISILGAAGGGGDVERTYPGGSPEEVISSARQAMSDLNSQIVTLEEALIKALKQDIATVESHIPSPGTDLDQAGKWELVMPAPSVVTDRGPLEHK